MPPNTPEDVEDTIKEINNKLHYYMENPYGGPEQPEKREGGERVRENYGNDKYNRAEKVKYVNKDKKVIKT
jgi:hypothetical protein